MSRHVLVSNFNESILNELNHGDIVILYGDNELKTENTDNHFKKSEIKYVCEQIEDGKVTKTLIDCGKTETELEVIPLAITAKWTSEELIQNYANKFNELKKYKNMFKGIQLDPMIHQSILKKFTGDREIHPTRQCFYFFIDPDNPKISDSNNNETSAAFIWHDNPKNLDAPEDKRFIELSDELDKLFIGEQPLFEHDPEVVEIAEKFKKVYENLFLNHLKSLSEGAKLYASLIPKNPIEELESETIDSTIVFHLKKLEYSKDNDKEVEFVVVKSFDDSEEYKFYREVCTQYGPYQNTHLWVTMYCPGRDTDTGSSEYFLDLPSSLYRLLD